MPILMLHHPEESPSTDAGAHVYSLVQTVAYDDGLRVTISKPVTFKPSEYAAGTEGFTKFVTFTVTIENRTGSVFAPTLASANLMSGDVEGSEVYDIDGRLGVARSSRDHEAAIFTSTGH